MVETTTYTVNRRPDERAFLNLWTRSWGSPTSMERWNRILDRSLCYVCAYDGANLIGFVNVAWDGGIHASVFDTTVDPDHRRRGIGSTLVRRAATAARSRGAEWLHVDFEPHLAHFYRTCGFQPTDAGLLDLTGPHSPGETA